MGDQVVDHTKLEDALEDFKRAMQAKFEAVAYKHPDRSVTTVGNRLLDQEGVYEGLWEHFDSEVREFHEATHRDDQMAEAVDVANMAFLIWWRDRGR